MIAWILARVFPPRLRLAPEELQVTLAYHQRQSRMHPLDIESDASRAIPMMIYQAEPGQYVGLGNTVIKERRDKTHRARWTGGHDQYMAQLRQAEESMAAFQRDLVAQGYVNTIHDCWEKEEK